MALSNINILRQSGGLAKTPNGVDGISGLMIYGSTKELSKKYFKADDSLADFAKNTIEHYQISEYFNYSDYPLYFKSSTSGTTDFDKIVELKNFSNGEIRQFGILDLVDDFTQARTTTIQAKMKQLEDEFSPAVAVFSADLGTDNIEDLTSLRTLNNRNVSVCLSEDYTDITNPLRTTHSFVSNVGACLGNISKANAHENIGFVQKFPVSTGSNYNDSGFIDGSKLIEKDVAVLNTLDDYGYIFLRKHTGISNVYFNYSHTAISETDDFSTLELNRVYNKAFLEIRKKYLPYLNAPLYVNEEGKLAFGTIKTFEDLGNTALQPMENAGEISAFSVEIDPEQKVLSTSKLEVIVKIIPVGTAKTIEVKLGYALTL